MKKFMDIIKLFPKSLISSISIILMLGCLIFGDEIGLDILVASIAILYPTSLFFLEKDEHSGVKLLSILSLIFAGIGVITHQYMFFLICFGILFLQLIDNKTNIREVIFYG